MREKDRHAKIVQTNDVRFCSIGVFFNGYYDTCVCGRQRGRVSSSYITKHAFNLIKQNLTCVRRPRLIK